MDCYSGSVLLKSYKLSKISILKSNMSGFTNIILVLTILAFWQLTEVNGVDIECSSKLMVVKVKDDGQEYMMFPSKPNKTTLQCMFRHSHNSKHSLVMPPPFTKCKTYISSHNLTSTVFSNKVWQVARQNNSLEFRLVAEFSCAYPSQYQVFSTMKKMKSKSESRKTMDDPILCPNPFDCPNYSCQHKRVKNYVIFTNRDTINLILRKKQFKTTKSKRRRQQIASLDSLHITCNPSSPSRRFRLNSYSNGCNIRTNNGSNVHTSADYNAMADTICISFPLFELRRSVECTEFHITALVRNCSEDSRKDCDSWIGGVHCPANTASNSISQVSVGPIYLLPHMDSKSAIIHYKTNTDEVKTFPNDVDSAPPTTTLESTIESAATKQILTATPTMETTENETTISSVNSTLTADRSPTVLTDQQFTKEPEPLEIEVEAKKPKHMDLSTKTILFDLKVRENGEFDVFDYDHAEEPVIFKQDPRTFGDGSILENIVDERYLGEYNDHYDQYKDDYYQYNDDYDQYIDNYYDADDGDNVDNSNNDRNKVYENEKANTFPITAAIPIFSQRKMVHERYFKWTLIVVLSSLVVASVAVGFTLYLCRRSRRR